MRRKRNSPIEEAGPILVGYARVSTEDQDLSMQIEALRRAGVEDRHLYTDKKSGSSMRRQGLEHALLDAREGDVLVVWRLDRLSRSLEDLVKLSQRLKADGIELRSLHEQIDTTTPMGKFYFHLMAALAEFERSLIGWRTKKGMEAARERGSRFGPEPKFGPREIAEAVKLWKRNPKITGSEMGRRFGVSGSLVRQKVQAKVGRPLWRTKPRKVR